MTREEIRMKIYKLLWRVAENKTFPSDALEELNELVVIKVDSDAVPDKCLCNLTEGRGYPNCGVVAVEPLI